jgi:hypothetical protein
MIDPPPGRSTTWLGGRLQGEYNPTAEHGGSGSAVFGPHRAYRYFLSRQWSDRGPLIYVLLNPSTADAYTADPTVTRCIERAWRLGFGGAWILNLFALVATDAAELRRADDPVGPDNDAELSRYLHPNRQRPGTQVCVGWGTWGHVLDRGAAVNQMLTAWRTPASCLGVNGDGSPKHPLYLGYDQPLLPYPPAGS